MGNHIYNCLMRDYCLFACKNYSNIPTRSAAKVCKSSFCFLMIKI